MSTSPTPDLSTPYLDALAKRIWSAISAFATWFAKHPWRAMGRFVRWLGKLISSNARTTMLVVGLALAGVGVGLRFGAWAGLLAPGATLSLVAIFGVAATKAAKPSN